MPKEGDNNFVPGADLARLLRVLVTTANDGSLSGIPSRWDSHVDSSRVADYCITFYIKELDAFLAKSNNEPVDMQ